ncbi:hypothetical protein RHMOL_Rhmol13G0258100 [Rhododendron molle]|uniref:Uncharacterized protein n=1 Tax=Rhododendron molle TaxID=49168 RepID=A0ACC0LBS8_RHOML|nr:hypothetical protein RHMOL_Rhmol13G0258100 [Rhododendron molle]
MFDKEPTQAFDFFDRLAQTLQSRVFVKHYQHSNSNVVEEDIAPPIFVEDVNFAYESPVESEWGVELNIHCSLLEKSIFIEESDSFSENSSEFRGNDEFHSQCSPLESSPPLEFLPLCEAPREKHLIAEKVNVDETESWSPICEDPALVVSTIDQVSTPCGLYPLGKLLTLKEMDEEVDYLHSLLEERDQKIETNCWSPTCAKQDSVGVEFIEAPFMDSLWEEQDNAYETKSRFPTLENSNLVGVEQIDFLGVNDFDFLYRAYMVDFVNNLKINLIWLMPLVDFKFMKRIRQLLYSKYLFLWHGRIPFLKQSVEWSAMFILLALVGMINARSPRLAEHT